jgi:pimeloyl-ACP methyl ester carboxylesterase
MGPVALQFDVTDALPTDVTQGTRLLISAWLFFPDDPSKLGARPVTMTLLAGGSYDKRYHHAIIPGRSGYSAAEHLANLGTIVLLADHLGVGESTKAPDQKKATRNVVALANHAAVLQFHTRLANGDLHPALPAFTDVVRIGGGHSMGAMQTVIQQAAHRSYDAIMFLGYTTQGVNFYMEGKRVRAADYLPQGKYPDYATNDRAAQHHNFHWGDVPADVIAADDALAVETPTSIGLDSIRTDIVKPDAARIDVPVFFGHGERDVSPDPRAEANFFPLCRDFTLFILPHSAHCQTFASTRHLFWNRMHHWSRGILAGLR